jgi:DNA primase
MTTSIIVIEDGKDPDEALKKNPTGFKKAMRDNLGIYDYLLDKFVSENNKDSAQGKKAIADNLLPLFANISNEIVKEHYLKKLSAIFEISLDSLLKEVAKLKQKTTENVVVAAKKNIRPKRENDEIFTVALILQSENPKEIVEEYKKILLEYKFATLPLQRITESLINYFENNQKLDVQLFSKSLLKELLPVFDECYLYPVSRYVEESRYQEAIAKQMELLKDYIKRDNAKSIKN